MKRRAYITGITGQMGSYMSEFLLEKDYEVFGLLRRSSSKNFDRIKHIENDIELMMGDLCDQESITRSISSCRPNEVYNLAAQSFVPASWDLPVYTSDVTSNGCLRVLEAIRNVDQNIKFYQAASSEQFGNCKETPQNEKTPFYPRSPYGCSKVFSYWITVNYRESYKMFACAAINFNNESCRRGLDFITRKVTNGVARIKLGLGEELRLGNLEAKRDWSHTKDVVRGAWLMLQREEPDDFVIGTGITRPIRELCRVAFKCVNLDWEDYVIVDPKFFRPAEVFELCADATKAKRILQWKPEIAFDDMIKEMVDNDLKIVKEEMKKNGQS